jgi:hypothetical protein
MPKISFISPSSKGVHVQIGFYCMFNAKQSSHAVFKLVWIPFVSAIRIRYRLRRDLSLALPDA